MASRGGDVGGGEDQARDACLVGTRWRPGGGLRGGRVMTIEMERAGSPGRSRTHRTERSDGLGMARYLQWVQSAHRWRRTMSTLLVLAMVVACQAQRPSPAPLAAASAESEDSRESADRSSAAEIEEPEEPAAQQPAERSVDTSSVERANHALRKASACIEASRSGSEPEGTACEALDAASAERVRFPLLEETQGSEVRTPVVELVDEDGSWRRLEEADGEFHGFLWVEEAKMYLGHASWYGEEGGVVVFLPGTTEMLAPWGTPVLSPDGSLLAGGEIDPFSDNQLVLRVFALEPSGVSELLKNSYSVGDMAERVDELVFEDARNLRIEVHDGNQASPVWIDIDSGTVRTTR